MKQRMEQKDLELLSEKQKINLQKLWTPKEGDFILNTSANRGNGHIFTNYVHQPRDDSPSWELMVEEKDKKSFLYPMLNVLQMLEIIKNSGYERELEVINCLDFDNLFNQIYMLFADFLSELA